MSVAYAVPAAAVRHTLPDTHAVDADPVAVAFAVPAAAVTHTLPDTHAVDADPVAVAYAVPAAAVTSSAPVTLADWDDTGLVDDFSALIQVSGVPILYADSNRGGSDTPLDGNLRINDTTDLSRIQWDGSLLSWNDNDDPGTTNLESYYKPGGDGNGLTIYITVNDGGTVTTASFDVATYYPGDLNAGSELHPLGRRHAATAGSHGLARRTGRQRSLRLLFRAGGHDAPRSDADPVAVAYAVPEPAVTYTHRRDAGPVAVAYTVPPAEITYARGPRSFAVDADPVSVEYFVHIALVTHVSVAAPPIVKWLRLVGLPWSNIARRWKIAEAQGRVMQRLITAGGHAMREWWPLTARPAGLATWGRTVRRPQRTGETGTEYRERVANRKREPVGTSGWVRDEVQRITGDDPPRVIELPREGLRLGYSPLGTSRLVRRRAVADYRRRSRDISQKSKAVLEKGVSPRIGINYVDARRV